MTGNRAFIHSAELDSGGYPPECPFSSKRAGMTRDTVMSMGLLDGARNLIVEPERLTRKEIGRYHAPDYIQALADAGQGDLDHRGLMAGLGTPDCPVFRDMLDFLALAAGGSVTGARVLLNGEAAVAFNPSGGFHHAGRANAAGFCYINDVVLAALEFVEAGKRVLFLDLDAHHSDGVQGAFYERSDVMVVSFHESGHTLFPGSGFEDEIGSGPGTGYSVNLPLPVGTHDDIYEEALQAIVVPLLTAFAPDVIMVELGMDGLSGDPLAHLHLTNNVYASALRHLLDAGRPLLALGGGGYQVENTVRGWALAWSIMCGEEEDDMMLGMGGVMLENTSWAGGLRDRILLSDAGRRDDIAASIRASVKRLQEAVFPLHGLSSDSPVL